MEYKLAMKKSSGNWWTYGNFKKNQWGNYQASFKITQDFKDLIAGKNVGEYINFSAFEDNGEKKQKQESKHELNYSPEDVLVDDEIPF